MVLLVYDSNVNSDEAWFTFSRYTNSLTSSYRSTGDPPAIHKVPCTWFKNRCIVYIYLPTPCSRIFPENLTASQLVKFPTLYGSPMVHYCIYECPPPVPVLSSVQVAFGKRGPCRSRFLMLSMIISIWHTFLFSSLKKKSHGLFMQGSSHTGNKSHKYSTWNFWCASEGLWPVCLPDLNRREFYSWAFKVKFYVIILSVEKWKKISSLKFPIYQPRWQCHVSRNVFPRCGACIKAGQHLGLFFEVMQVIL